MPTYTAVRTDKSARALILRELTEGRLRQGWGGADDQDLRKIRARRQAGETLSKHERSAWGNRRLLEESWDGLQTGDVLLLPNLPEQGQWLFARITGPYRFDKPHEWKDYGHIRPVELIRSPDRPLAVVHPSYALVPAGLRRSMRCMHRMWSLDQFSDAIEAILAAITQGAETNTPMFADQRLEAFAKEMRANAYELIDHAFGGAELEQLALRVLTARYRSTHPEAKVEHKGGRNEHGIDILVELPDPLGVDLRIGVQVKKHVGTEWAMKSLHQLEEARAHWGIHAGVVLTTAETFSEGFEAARSELEEKLKIPIRVILREEFVGMVLAHLTEQSTGE